MEVAQDGVLFLDEISSMPMDLQAKFLRALEERAIRRVGGTNLIPVNVQVIAASNRNLKEMIAKHEFREDLYYRLKVVDLDLPSLSERKVDIPDLVGYYLQYFNQIRQEQPMNPKAMEALINFTGPATFASFETRWNGLFCLDSRSILGTACDITTASQFTEPTGIWHSRHLNSNSFTWRFNVW